MAIDALKEEISSSSVAYDEQLNAAANRASEAAAAAAERATLLAEARVEGGKAAAVIKEKEAEVERLKERVAELESVGAAPQVDDVSVEARRAAEAERDAAVQEVEVARSRVREVEQEMSRAVKCGYGHVDIKFVL